METIQDKESVLALNENVCMTDWDEDTGLELFCYTNCTNSDTDFLKQCRGLVYHKDKLIMGSFPFASEYTTDEVEPLRKEFSNFSEYTFYYSYEGTLLRMFFFSGRWFLATHRKLDAFRSRWSSSQSFGTLFKRALEHQAEINLCFKESLGEGDNILTKFESSLDTTKQYVFLLRNTEENRIVCNAPTKEEPYLYHVGTFIDGNLSMNNYGSPENYLHIPMPPIYTCNSVEQLIEHVAGLDYRVVQGIIAVGEGKFVKLYNTKYQEYFKVRGNEPSIRFRYLQVRMNRDLRNKFLDLYTSTEHKLMFVDYENALYEIAKYIYNAYVTRYIKKNFIIVPREEYKVMQECHAWHLSDRTNNKVSLEKIIELLNNQNPVFVNHMIRHYKADREGSVE